MKHAAIGVLLMLGTVSFAQETQTGPRLTGSDLIDSLVKAKWTEIGLKPESRSDDAEFLRRVYLDIVGRIPTLPEAEKFLADKANEKRRKLVDALIDSEAFAENWAQIWAASLVGADSNGRAEQIEAGYAKALQPLIAKNMPFDAFARELMTAEGKIEYTKGKGDTMSEGDGALVTFFFRYQKSAGKELPQALAGKFSRTFLGTQIQCAQCHDHPFDVWTPEDFYGMAGFWQGMSVRQEKNKDTGEETIIVDDRPGKRRMESMTMPGTTTKVSIGFLKTKEKPKEGEGLRSAFARLMTAKENLQFARATVNRYWAHFSGRGFVNPIDEFNGRNKPTHPELLEELAKDFQNHNFDIPYLVRAICNSQTYQITSASKKRDAEAQKYYSLAMVRPLSPEQILHSVVTAVSSDAAGANSARKDLDVRRTIRDFRYPFADDEGAEAATFEGSIPAALLMMNSQLVAAGITAASRASGARRGSARSSRRRRRPKNGSVRFT